MLQKEVSLFLIMLFSAFGTVVVAQDYKSVIIPTDLNPNPEDMFFDGSRFLIKSLNFIDTIPSSSILKVNSNLELVGQHNFEYILLAGDNPQKYEEHYYFFGQDFREQESFYLLQADYHLDVTKVDTFTQQITEGGITSMLIHNNHLYGAIFDENQPADGRSEMNIRSFTLPEREEVYSIQLDSAYRYFFSRGLTGIGQDLLVSGNVFRDFASFATLYRLSPEGSVAWRYDSPVEQSRGNAPVQTAVLSDGNIVYTDKVSMPNLWPDHNDKPVRLGWLSPEGDSLQEFIYLVPRLDFVEFNGIKEGKGDYFFVFGNRDVGDLDYGLIMKIANDGTILWEHYYIHEMGTRSLYYINDLEEMPNGDLVTLGSIIPIGSKGEIWMMRLNEFGCLGNEDCGDFPLSTSEVLGGNEKRIILTPNPARDQITVENIDAANVSTIRLHGIGSSISRVLNRSVENKLTFAIGDLAPGVYIIHVTFKDGSTSSEKFVKI